MRRISEARTLLALGMALACAGAAGAAERPGARGYLTTPLELQLIRQKADAGIEPYASSVAEVLARAADPWIWPLGAHELCPDANSPGWNDNGGGTPVLYANALAYHLTGNAVYAERLVSLLESIMQQVQDFDLEECELQVAWGAPELVASADLIEAYWEGRACVGPLAPTPGDTAQGNGPCKRLFQNWLAKNAYSVVSLPASRSQSNRGAAATNAAAHIADYLWDRTDLLLVHRNPPPINAGAPYLFTPAQAYAHANQLARDRMNGYAIELQSDDSCDFLGGPQQSSHYAPVKSQITRDGILPEDARRAQFCNIPVYDETYQNYPQIHVGCNVQQCELMLRRGDRSCYDNQDASDLPGYPVLGPDGVLRTTHLLPGRGSLERAIAAVILDARVEWRHDEGLQVATHYYRHYGQLPGMGGWLANADRHDRCDQDACFATLTHGFALEFPLKALDAPVGGEATLVDVDLATGAARVPLEYAACTEPSGSLNAVRGVAATAGLAYWRDRLYGVELASSPPAAYLYEMAPSLCAAGERIGTVPIGFAGLESLAACPDGWLYSAEWNAAAARARLLRIDRFSGIGTPVGTHVMAPDRRIVGLTCTPDGSTLFALTGGGGSLAPELLSVDPATGVETLVGPTATAVDALRSLELDRSAATTRLLAAGAALYRLDPVTGAATLLGGSFGGVRALAMPQPTSGPDSDGDGVPDPEDNCRDLANPTQVDADADGYGNFCDNDFNQDGLGGTLDLLQLGRAFGAAFGSPRYDAEIDMNSDGVVGAPDLLLWARMFADPPGPSGLACAGATPCP